MRAAVGSKNPVKIAAAMAVLRRLYGTGVDVLHVDAPSDVHAQPWGNAETRRGAINRARAAQGALSADLGIGLEGGVLEIENDRGERELYTSAWCAVVDREGTLGIAGGANVLLPAEVAAAVTSGMELGAAMDQLTGEEGTHHRGGAIGILTQDWLDRRQAFEHVLTLAFARFLTPHFYTDED